MSVLVSVHVGAYTSAEVQFECGFCRPGVKRDRTYRFVASAVMEFPNPEKRHGRK